MLDLNNKQISFNLEPVQRYGLKQKNGEFLRVYYSGINYGLLFNYNSLAEAELARNKYTFPEDYTVEAIPLSLIEADTLEFIKRIES